MKKTDYKKELPLLYKVRKNTIVEVEVPKMNFLMIDGEGNPNTSEQFQQAIEALYSVSYGIKFTIKKCDAALDYIVMPLEGLWWAEDMAAYTTDKKDDWKWTLMIMQPEVVTADLVSEVIKKTAKKKDISALSLLRFEAFEEGLSSQLLHIGPFSEEGPNIQKLHDFIAERGQLTGKHHEIYLSDTRRAAPENWKTILRQPFTEK